MSELNGAAPVATTSSTAPVTPSNTPTTINVTPIGTPAPSSDAWMTGFNDDMKGYVQNKGFKDPTSVLESYRNLEKLVGVPKERLLKLPERDDAPEWNEVYERLGKPKDAKDYKFNVDDNPESKAFADWAQKTFHEIGLPKKQAEALVNKFNERSQGAVKAESDAYQARIAQEDSNLKKEWGAAYEQNTLVGKRAVQAFGFTGEVIDKLEQSMGYENTMKFMHNLGSKLGEDGFVGGKSDNKFNGVMTPESARQRINDLRKDPDFGKKLTSGDVSAKEQWDRLHKFASPAE